MEGEDIAARTNKIDLKSSTTTNIQLFNVSLNNSSASTNRPEVVKS